MNRVSKKLMQIEAKAIKTHQYKYQLFHISEGPTRKTKFWVPLKKFCANTPVTLILLTDELVRVWFISYYCE